MILSQKHPPEGVPIATSISKNLARAPSLRKSHLSDKSRVSDKQYRQSTHFSFRPNVDDGSKEDGEIEEEINQDSRVTRNRSKVTRKTAMFARSEEEMMGLVGDEDYEDDFEEDEDQ